VLWYRVVDGRWASGSGTAIPLDARPYSALASGGDGVLYGVRKDDKRLQRLTTTTATSPTGQWSSPVDVGRSWDDERIAGTGTGVLLGVSASGDVHWYRVAGGRAGKPTWDGRSGTVVGNGFTRYAALAPVATDCGGYALPLDKQVLTRAALLRPHHDYPAVDLPVPVGTPVHVVRGGKVASAGPSGLCGLGVVLQATDGGRYVYCHLSRIEVADGQTVATGSLLGLSGNTGHTTGPHLHVGVSSAGGIARCPQTLLLAVYDGATVPAPSALPSSGCSYAGLGSPR
jgi:murein DD-endopeptidase MepM/ murein hydrolase activator NlpD